MKKKILVIDSCARCSHRLVDERTFYQYCIAGGKLNKLCESLTELSQLPIPEYCPLVDAKESK